MTTSYASCIFLLLACIASLAESFASINGRCTIKKHTSSSSALLLAIANPFKSPTDHPEQKDKGGKRKKNRREDILHVESIEEYKEKVVEESDRITVVRFFSRYCRSCRASEPLFYKLASDFRDQGVKFVEVPLNKHTGILHDALGVPSLPWTHIYHPDAGLVEERKVSKKFIDEVRKCLRCYVYGECDLADAPADCMNIYGECAIDD
mmetsp:Transcript_23257/g.39755  ORF Transcript_23257/g.39755 Transcript_23257/m.39755 type:complete len:208 (-) Transcript_23257:105-728(-)|eukprot:CAMPEP_0183710778 /NCGR_PEP_ID=MMETSP0737-20130205/6428_1 /TAXON_ID=385413 /ORGANISM="Thalassiosira miniscula, Strain CCMP1093" /LENGTH=207 /DNA_ID=CAMNT_0025939117 /DNA_START=123 /DNA_END=746 /DNA_ORIENTATION=+